MSLSYNEFRILESLTHDEEVQKTRRGIADYTGMSLGLAQTTIKELEDKGFVDAYCLTEAGLGSLEPYKVDNAIIMAAGLSSRFAPISYEKPKGVLTVRGEVLIERQIRQLQEAGITDISVVVGYKKEEFFYLEDMLGVKIVINDDYASRNNNSTIKKVEGRLGNTFICSSDDYFVENPFEKYVFESYYAAEFVEGPTPEYCLETKGKDHRIVGVTVGGSDAWVMVGHAYWNRAFSSTFCDILNRVYERTDTASKLWEDIYLEHIDDLPMVMRPYENGTIWEFDSLDEVREFDPFFIDNVDSSIMDNICKVLECERADIRNIVPIKQGLTNLSFRFDACGGQYVYRHPGFGTEAIISRKSETFTQKAASDLGIDGTFIFEDENEGWKISRFIPDCVPFDIRNMDHLKAATSMIRKLHQSGVTSAWNFDIHEDTIKQMNLLNAERKRSFKDFEELFNLAETLNAKVKADGIPPVLSHNDFYEANFLVSGDEIHLIDWEYSGMSDYASDLAVFICCSDYSYDEAVQLLELYFDRPLTDGELFHCVAYISVVSFHWFVWALYQDMCGSPVGEFLYLWYRYTKEYGRKAMEMAEKLGR